MSVKGEKYKSVAAKKRHEAKESPAMRLKEYGKIKTKPMKKGGAKKIARKMVKM
jgi:hypothetical protein